MKLSNRCAAISASRLLLVGLLSGLVMYLPAGAQESNVYKWVDQHGITHYTDIPPVTGTSELLSINSRRTDNQAVRSMLADRGEASEAARKKAAQQAEQAAIDTKEQARLDKHRRENCTKARSSQQKYDEAHRLYNLGDDGEREYLSSAEIDAARVKARNSVQEWCSE